MAVKAGSVFREGMKLEADHVIRKDNNPNRFGCGERCFFSVFQQFNHLKLYRISNSAARIHGTDCPWRQKLHVFCRVFQLQ
jgi:hypothetical protein